MNGSIPSDTGASEWRDRARYDRLTGFDQAIWAWECLRRAIGKDCQLFREAGGLLPPTRHARRELRRGFGQ